MRLSILLTLLSTLLISGCIYNENLNLVSTSYFLESDFKSQLEKVGITNIRCPLPEASYTTCYTLDKTGYEASFMLPIRIQWDSGLGLKMTKSAMSRFSPKELFDLIITEHNNDRIIDENIARWQSFSSDSEDK